MARKRSISSADAAEWLALLLDYAFSDSSAQHAAQLDLLHIAHDSVAYPHDIPAGRLAELLLIWSEKHVDGESWQRLQSRVRKRRARVCATGTRSG